jgi:hypothetical protein
MHAQRWLSVLPWSGAAIALVFGMAARDCILLASAAMLAIYTARTQAETREAVDLFRGAIQCWVIGGASLLVAILLVAMVAGTHASLWDGNGLDTQSMLSVLGHISSPLRRVRRLHCRGCCDGVGGVHSTYA